MRLLHSTTFEFKVFNDEELPPYAILSHTWGDEEVSYQDQRFLQRLVALPDNLRKNEAYIAALEAAAGLDFTMMGRGDIGDRAGYRKLEKTAKIAKEMNLDWFWADTCCIDKSSSAELQEAINSMYRWYQNSTYCIVYLEDAEFDMIGNPIEGELERMLRDSKWITRGWTLQELIAPTVVAFYDAAWVYISKKHKALSCIRGITGIPEYVLATGDLSRASVAQKMAWAAMRTTSRVEDIAYSLLGIFQVHMPMLYGERENAFQRLQEEIVRTTADDSIFAWTSRAGSLSTYRGLFARSPKEFQDSQLVSRGHGIFGISNMGLRLEMVLQSFVDEQRDDDLYLGLLNAPWGNNKRIALILRKLEGPTFARVAANQFEDWLTPSGEAITTLYVRHTPEIPPDFQCRMLHALRFRRGLSDHSVPTYAVEAVRPSQLAAYNPRGIIIPRKPSQMRHDFMVSRTKGIFIAIIKLSHVVFKHDGFPSCPPMHLLVGYSLETGRSWCRILGEGKWPHVVAGAELWRAALSYPGAFEDGETEATFSTGLPGVRKIHVKVSPGLFQDQISLMVDIDGLWDESSTLQTLRYLTVE